MSQDKYQEIYETEAELYDQLIRCEDTSKLILPTLEAICSFEQKDIVEFGAGTGRLTLLLAPIVRSIQAFDAAAPMLEIAKNRLREQGTENWFVAVADNRSLPISAESADIAIEGWSFGHIMSWFPETWQSELGLCLDEMKRVLRPGGHAILIETLGTGFEQPKAPSERLKMLYQYLEEDLGLQASWCRTDYSFSSLEEAKRLAGFFFGEKIFDSFTGTDKIFLPECTGFWCFRKDK